LRLGAVHEEDITWNFGRPEANVTVAVNVTGCPDGSCAAEALNGGGVVLIGQRLKHDILMVALRDGGEPSIREQRLPGSRR
jgi:hypothetical protein